MKFLPMLSLSMSSLLLSACVIVTPDIVVNKDDVIVTSERPKNIIMIVSDGMGPAYTTAYRYYAESYAFKRYGTDSSTSSGK